MIKKRYFLPLLAALALSSCSSEDNVINNEPENKDLSYVAVNIVQPKSVGSRADADNQFQNGTDDENYASDALFFIFDKDGNSLDGNVTAQRVKLTKGTDVPTSPKVEVVYNAVLVINGQKEKPKEDIQIVCVLNAPTNAEGEPLETGITTLSQLEEKVADYSAHEKGTFIMTNSVYKEDGAKVLGAMVTSEYLFENATQALAKPVEIYVERVVAKIKTTVSPEFQNLGAPITVDGVSMKLKIAVKGISLVNVSDKAYLFKSISGFENDAKFTNWVWDTTNKRSYWETMAAGINYTNQNYDEISLKAFEPGKALTDQYILPNTSQTDKTAILVTAQLTDDKDQPYEFVYLRGFYCSPDNAKNLIATSVAAEGYWKKAADGTLSSIQPDDFVWKNNIDLVEDLGKDATEEQKAAARIDYLKSYEVVARVNPELTIVTRDNNGNEVASSPEKVNEFLAGNATNHPYVARYYKDGMCTYFVNIDQTPVAQDRSDTTIADKTFEGVVRNHIYELTINSIQGIGTPVFDPKDPIVPDTPDDEHLWFLSARINVLKWRIVKQNVDFTGK